MATIEKRTLKGKTTYRVKIRHRGYPPETATFDRLTDAKMWAQTIETQMNEGRYFPAQLAKRHTLHDAIELYKESVLPRKPKSSKDQTRHLSRWDEELGDYSLSAVTSALIAGVRAKLISETVRDKKMRTPATVNRYMGTLSHLFTIAIKEWGWLHENPVSRLSKLKEPRGRTRFLSDEERHILLRNCRESDSAALFPIVILCLSTGARKMEIAGLEKAEVDPKRKVILLQDTKNGEQRLLHLGSFAWSLLEEALEKSPPDSPLVFPSPCNPNRSIDIKTAWDNALKKAKIQNFRFHDLRHSAASYLAMNGATLAEISEVLGHKTLSMVKRYAHLSESHTAKVVEAMNEKIFANLNKTAPLWGSKPL